MSLRIYKDFKFTFDSIIDLNITKETIKFKTSPLDNKNTNIAVYNSLINFSDLKTKADRCGFDRWTIVLNRDGTHSAVKNIYVDTYISKLPTTEYFEQNNSYGIIQIITRPEDTSFEDCVIFLNMTENSVLNTNATYSETPRLISGSPKYYYPNINISEINRDDEKITFQVTTPTNVNESYFVKSDNGFVSSKVFVNNGIGTFNFIPIGMATGDKAVIKVGLKFYSNIKSIEVTI